MKAAWGATRSAAAVPLAAALVLCALGLYPLANRLTGGEAVTWYGQARTFWLVIGGTLFLVLLGAVHWQGERMDRMAREIRDAILRIPTPVFLPCAATFAVAASAVLAVVCFGRQPHNIDEVAQLFHARILLSGRLSLSPDPDPEFFAMENVIDSGRWYSQFPVGGPAFLAIGLALRAAWLVNPVLLGLTILAVYGFARRTYGEPTARATALLLALCPFALFMSASFMNHVPVLWLTSVALMQLAVWMETSSDAGAHRAAAIIGLSLGVAFAVRPLDALIAAGVIGLMQLAHLRRDASRIRSLVVQVVAGLIPVALLFYVNWRTTGAPMRLGYEVLYGDAHSLGFHEDPYGTAHTPLRAITFASKYLMQLDVLLFEWPLPAIGIIAAGLLALRRPTRWDLFLIGLLFAQLIAYAMYWHDGTFRGPRFLYNALPAIVMLAVRAPFAVAAVTRGTARRMAIALLPACVLFAWLAYGVSNSMAGRARMYRRLSPILRTGAADVQQRYGLHHALVFINEGRQSRNLHDLWTLGVPRGSASRLMKSASACAMRVSINAEAALPVPRADGRLSRLQGAALAFDREPRVETPAACAEEVRLDEGGLGSYAPFFPANAIDAEGRIAGDVVYVLDLGQRNEELRSRFGDRTWYRLGVRRPSDGSLLTLEPYTTARR